MAKGVQIIWTPWRNHTELLRVKAQLYKPPQALAPTPQEQEAASKQEDPRRTACALISAWKLRAPLPHALESTWLLTEAGLSDAIPSVPLFAVKAAYVTAISRFVTAHLDPLQPVLHKRSMYALAQEINLPAVFVDIRHDGAHGEMPSLDILRDASKKALQWLWDYYWVKLEAHPGEVGDEEDEDAEMEGEYDLEGEQKIQQPGGWTLWEGPWFARPVGVVP